MKLGIIGYVPPPNYANGVGNVFLENLKRNRPHAEMILYSDYHGYKSDWFKFIPLVTGPEIFRNHPVNAGKQNDFAMNNGIWVTGMFFASQCGFTHVIYLESDCRFGEPGWDIPMWEEFFGAGKPLVAAGSLVCWNPCIGGYEAVKRWQQLIASNSRKNFPIPTYGYGSTFTGKPSVFPNGALGIYDVNWIKQFIDVTDTLAMVKSHAWDFMIGDKIWERFGVQSYDVVHHLNCIYSSYGEQVSTEAERLAMLKSKQAVAVHQIKSTATI